MTRLQLHPFVYFVLVGILNSAFGYGLFVLLHLLSGSHRFAIVLTTALGVLFNFFTTGTLVFGNRSYSALIPFVLGYAGVCILNVVLVDVIVAYGHSPLVAQVLVLPVLVVITFVINDRLVFGKSA